LQGIIGFFFFRWNVRTCSVFLADGRMPWAAFGFPTKSFPAWRFEVGLVVFIEHGVWVVQIDCCMDFFACSC